MPAICTGSKPGYTEESESGVAWEGGCERVAQKLAQKGTHASNAPNLNHARQIKWRTTRRRHPCATSLPPNLYLHSVNDKTGVSDRRSPVAYAGGSPIHVLR